jgi:hypothetical protein
MWCNDYVASQGVCTGGRLQNTISRWSVYGSALSMARLLYAE